jgi:hypothetical protein
MRRLDIQTVTIEQIENAINIWRNRHPSTDANPALCLPARALANVYGQMIYERQTEIAFDMLDDEQCESFVRAFDPQPN